MKAVVRLVDRNATINVNGVSLSGEEPMTTELTENVKQLEKNGLIHLSLVDEKSEAKGKKTTQMTL